MINLLADDKDWLVRVFGKTTVKHYNSAAFLLQCDVLIELARDKADNYLYDNFLIWEGFQFCFKERGSTHNFAEFISYKGFDKLKTGRRRERYNRTSSEREEELEYDEEGLAGDHVNMRQLRLDQFVVTSN